GLERLQLLAGVGVPAADEAVALGARDERLAVGGEEDRAGGGVVLVDPAGAGVEQGGVAVAEREHLPAGGDLEDAGGGVLVGHGGDALAVGAEGDGRDRPLVAPELAEEVAGVGVPQPDGAAVAGGDGLAVGAEGDGPDRP